MVVHVEVGGSHDAFTQRSLAVLDPLLAAQGQTAPLGEVTGVAR